MIEGAILEEVLADGPEHLAGFLGESGGGVEELRALIECGIAGARGERLIAIEVHERRRIETSGAGQNAVSQNVRCD